MATSKRGKILERHQRILNALDKSFNYTSQLRELFEGHHSGYEEGYEIAMNLIAQAHKLIESIKEKL